MSDTLWAVILTGLSTLAINYFAQWLQRKFHPGTSSAEDADAAIKWEALNQRALARISSLEKEVEDLKQTKVGPFRITLDISTFPDARIIRDEIVLMRQLPIESSKPSGEEKGN